MRITDLEKLVGGLSNPSKMPGLSYGTPAKECNVGSVLRAIPDSVCSKCYARKGMYSFPVVADAQARRLEILSSDLDLWTANMIQLIGRKYQKKTGDDAVFRWHDSGDLISLEHLSALCDIARAIPHVSFWLPTKEYAIVRKGIRTLEIPSNLVIRISAPMIGQSPNEIPGTVASTVGTGEGWQCPAYSQDGKCGDCRACWDPSVPIVDYPQH